MTRLPVTGSDTGIWGEVLNDFLTQSHKQDGTLKDGIVGASAIAAGSIDDNALAASSVTLPKIATSSAPTSGQVLSYNGTSLAWSTPTSSGSVPDAGPSTKGLIQLSGDLSGTAASPTVTGLASKANSSVVLTAGTGLTGGGDLTAGRTLSVSSDTTTQRIRVSKNGTLAANRQEVNLIEGSNVTITAADDGANNRVNVTIAAASGSVGEVNTASNVGASGIGVYKQKAGVNLEFRNINAGSSKVTVTDDVANNEIDVDVSEVNLNPANFSVNPLSRTNHTGTQLASTVSDFVEAAQDAVAVALAAGTHIGVTVTYDDASNSISLNASPTIAALPAGTTLTVLGSAGVWPARPTARSDIIVQWKGPDPSPSIVSSGTGGMLDNVDIRLVTP